MVAKALTIHVGHASSGYEIRIGGGLLNGAGKWARKCLGKNAAKVVIVSNPRIFGLYGKQTESALRESGFDVTHFLMKDGEAFKTLRSAESVLNAFAEAGLSRSDAVVALGGGVVGDLAGFASAVYLRGIAFLHMPTTLLSMVDSSVGGKTGVNTAFGKNLVGAFHQPRGVLIDTLTLNTLSPRELKAGFCEVVKHGAIAGRTHLERIDDFLAAYPLAAFVTLSQQKEFQTELVSLVSSQVAFKAAVVAGDERESIDRVDRRSRKILNFGHTLAHALEKVTDYKYLRHGEAVGYGILFAAELSKSLALLDSKSVNLLYDVLHRVGPLPPLADIDAKKVFEAFKSDKKNISGSLQMVLLKGLGKPVIISQRDIPRSSLQKTLKGVLRQWA